MIPLFINNTENSAINVGSFVEFSSKGREKTGDAAFVSYAPKRWDKQPVDVWAACSVFLKQT